MLKKHFEKILIVLFTLLGITALIFWLYKNPVKEFSASVPGLDNRPSKEELAASEIINIGEHFNLLGKHKSNLKGKWTNFRGADFDNICKDKTPLIDKFGPNGPQIIWEAEMGEGHAAPVIYNGKAYILDYNEEKKADVLRCFALETGEEIWQRWYKVHVKRNHGMSRTVPAINENYIVTIGPRCQVMCSNPENGDFLWGIDLVKEYNSEVPFWYTGQCPMIDGNEVILAPGGTALLMGVDLATGKINWKTPNPDNWKMSHSSIIPMELDGKKTYVYAAVGGICGISAEGDNKGEILWKTTDFNPTVVAPSPVILDNGKIYMTAGYGAGAILFQLKKTGDTYITEVLQKYKPKKGMASEQQTPFVYKGHMFTILPKDAGANRNQFVCCQPDDCMNILWTSGKTERFGLGPYIVADGKFFIVNDDGTLVITKASTKGFQVLDKHRIIEGHDAWGPIAIADGYLLMRDLKKLVCINIKK